MSWLVARPRPHAHRALRRRSSAALFLGALALGARALHPPARVRGDRRRARHARRSRSVRTTSSSGLTEEERQALKAGLEANMFEFRLANHSAILFNGDVPGGADGRPAARAGARRRSRRYREKPEVPYTAVEPYSGQNRTCRFLVTHLQGKAKGATLVVFRWIGPTLRSLARVDKALGGHGARRIPRHGGDPRLRRPPRDPAGRGGHASGRGGRGDGPVAARARLLGRRGVPAPGRRHQLALRPPRARLPRAAAPGRRRRPRAEDADRRPRRRGAGRAAARGHRRRAPPLPADDRRRLQGPRARGGRAAAARPRRRRVAAPDRGARPLGRSRRRRSPPAAALGARRGVVCAVSRSGDTRLRGERAGLLRLVSNLVSNAVLYTERRTPWSRCASIAGTATRSSSRSPTTAPASRRATASASSSASSGSTKTRARNPQGSGLGLAIVEQVVAAHGGSVEVRENEGGGAVFRVTLPATRT